MMRSGVLPRGVGSLNGYRPVRELHWSRHEVEGTKMINKMLNGRPVEPNETGVVK